MTTINDRIGSQNVIRVLSNASAPPSRLANLGDVDATREGETGLVLVWEKTDTKICFKLTLLVLQLLFKLVLHHFLIQQTLQVRQQVH